MPRAHRSHVWRAMGPWERNQFRGAGLPDGFQHDGWLAGLGHGLHRELGSNALGQMPEGGSGDGVGREGNDRGALVAASADAGLDGNLGEEFDAVFVGGALTTALTED